MLSWPAIFNGFPLLNPDSGEYLATGHTVLRKLLGGDVPAWMLASNRSEVYAAGLSLLEWGSNIWPVVAAQALMTAFVLWLVVRSLCQRPVRVYLALVAGLSFLTSVAWYASFAMPDILGALVYLGLYLVVFAGESLRPWEAAAVSAIVWWGAMAHNSHLLLAFVECLLLVVLWVARFFALGSALRGRGRWLLWAVGVIALAAGTQAAVHERLHGRASLFGSHPPYVTARVLADGPARLYLQQHCAALTWEICRHVDNLPTDEQKFIWQPGNIWSSATPEQRERLRAEEMPLVLATLRAYPLQQTEASLKNALRQLVFMGPAEFIDAPYFTKATLDGIAPGVDAKYRRTVQARNGMPQTFVRRAQIVVVALSVLVIVGCLPWLLRSGDRRLMGLAVIVVSVVPANAFVTGALSALDARYQGRVAWMVVLLAAMLCLVRLRRVKDAGRAIT
jgi:hypothetical protein